MPANFQRPSGNQFGEYLGELLGSDYNVTYIERRTAKGEVDPTTSFFHITQTKAGGQLATNLKINLGQPSDFTTDYGGAQAPVRGEAAASLGPQENHRDGR